MMKWKTLKQAVDFPELVKVPEGKLTLQHSQSELYSQMTSGKDI